MVKVLPEKISILPTFECYLEKPASLNTCFPFLDSPFFISTYPTPVRSLWLVRQSNIMDSKLVGINQNETPYLIP